MSHLKIFNKNYENGSLLYCPVGPLFTKKEEIGRFANAFNRILINKEGNVELKSYIYSSLPNPRWMANQYTGKDNGIHNFQLKKVNSLSTGSGEKSNEISEDFRHDSIEDIIRLNPFLSSLDRSVEKKILEESLGIDNFINQYEIIAKEIGEKMYESNDNELKLLRVLAYQTGKLFLYSFLTNKNHIYPSIQYSHFVETLSNLGSDKFDYNKLSESFSFLHSNLDFQDPFFEYAGDDEAKMAYECFPFFILALSIISFHDQGEFISRILGIEEAEEEAWESTVRKTTYNSFEKSLNLLVSARSKSSFVIVSLVKSVISKIITEGDDSFKRHNLSSPIISININFDSPPSGFREINFSADVPKLTALVMGRELYGDNANVIFIRELIQNSIDAIRARLRLDSKDFKPLIKISFSEQNNSFIVEDNGVGMSKIEAESYLLKVGRSIWRSKRLNKENETTPDSIGRFGIGFVSALYVSKLIRVTTLRYTLNSQAFNLVIRSVDKPVYVDEKIERKNIGTRIEVQLFDPISLNDFNSTLKNFFLFYPDGITFDYPTIPKTAKESLIESFTEDLETDFSEDYLLGKEIYTIKASDSELNFVVPALESLDKWKVSAPSQYKITNGCVFVSSGSIRSYGTIIPSMKLLNKGLFILSLKEGKFNISAKRSELEIPDVIIKGLDAPLNKEINRLYIELLNKYSNVNNFFYGNLWTGLKSIFDEAIIKHNSQLLNNFGLDLTFEGEDPKSYTLEKINSLTGYQFLDSRSNVFGSLYYQIYKSLKPKSNFVLIRASNRDNLLRQLINHKISSMSNTDFRTKIYNESLIPELQGHPLYNIITKYISVADNNFFKDNNLAGLFFKLAPHPVIEKIGMKRDKNRRNTRPTTFINSNHPWAISMSKISGLNLNEEKLLNIEKVIYWVLRSQGSEKVKYQNQLAKIPVNLGLESAPIEIE